MRWEVLWGKTQRAEGLGTLQRSSHRCMQCPSRDRNAPPERPCKAVRVAGSENRQAK